MKMIENIASVCLDHSVDDRAGRAAINWLDAKLNRTTIKFDDIDIQSNKIASILEELGVKNGDCVSIFLPRSADLIYSLFGIFKRTAIACILFSTFGETALLDRLDDSKTKVLVTKKSLLNRVKKIAGELKNLKAILVIDIDEDIDEKFLSLPVRLLQASDEYDYMKMVDAETPAFYQYTSGSTGKPKGAVHVHGGVKAMLDSFKEVFGLKANDRFWCTADPAWITGLVYGVIAPLALKVDQVQFAGGYYARSWLQILQDEKINVWYTAPTALRMMMKEEDSLFGEYNLSSLDRIFSVGEPLNPEIYHWGKEIFHCELYDNYFQSETGSIMITNRPAYPVKPGSMGKPLSYIQAEILDERFSPLGVNEQGHLCLVKGWPSMFRTYLNKPDLYNEKFSEDFYITGDLAYKDEEGYFWYVSRADDVINTAGHLVGPFEVESVLLEIEEVVDVAVVGAPDPILHQKIVAFICLKDSVNWDKKLELKCRVSVSNRVSTTAVPQEFIVVDTIPKNKSGKILRRVLKARYLGEDPGDISTIEE